VSRDPEFLADLLSAGRLTVNFVDEKKRRVGPDLEAVVRLTPESEFKDIWQGILAKSTPQPERFVSLALTRAVEVAVGIELSLAEPEAGPES
jgi:hypothetical protein